jgi:hypothetical protein
LQILILLTIAVHILCAIEVVRSGHVMPWLFFVLTVPFAGCLIYLVVMQGPQLQEAGAKAAGRMRKVVDPDQDLRAKRRQVVLVNSADAKRALAEECMKRGTFDEAVALFETAAMGPLSDDPTLLHGLARAKFYNNDPAGAQRALDDLRAANPDWQSAKAHLLYARALELQGKMQDALAEYEALIDYYPGEEARCRLALLLKKQGRIADARSQFAMVITVVDHAPKHYQRAQHDWFKVARRHLSV